MGSWSDKYPGRFRDGQLLIRSSHTCLYHHHRRWFTSSSCPRRRSCLPSSITPSLLPAPTSRGGARPSSRHRPMEGRPCDPVYPDSSDRPRAGAVGRAPWCLGSPAHPRHRGRAQHLGALILLCVLYMQCNINQFGHGRNPRLECSRRLCLILTFWCTLKLEACNYALITHDLSQVNFEFDCGIWFRSPFLDLCKFFGISLPQWLSFFFHDQMRRTYRVMTCESNRWLASQRWRENLCIRESSLSSLNHHSTILHIPHLSCNNPSFTIFFCVDISHFRSTR
jgi:hypothetical protein